MQRQRSHAGAAAFTLIELLVVVAIIALLISILLPSLQRAREQAKAVKDLATLRGLGTGMQTYATSDNGWIPGSPGTTGSILGPPGTLPGDAENTPGDAVQYFDWAGGMARELSMRASGNRSSRWRQLVERFRCPTALGMNLNSEPFYNSTVGTHGQFSIQPMVSYNTMRMMMWWHPANRGAPFSTAGNPGPACVNSSIAASIFLPFDYAPKIERLGNPAEKVFLADSCRFTPTTGTTDHNIAWDGDSGGGAFSDGGPTQHQMFMRSYFLSSDTNATYQPLIAFHRRVYRHGPVGRSAINCAFFDGHGEPINEKRSRHPDFWFPKETVIIPSEFNLQTLMSVPMTTLTEMHGVINGSGTAQTVVGYKVRR